MAGAVYMSKVVFAVRIDDVYRSVASRGQREFQENVRPRRCFLTVEMGWDVMACAGLDGSTGAANAG
jgi:hypothetical protein